MRRFVIFILLGPIVGTAVMTLIVAPVSAWMMGRPALNVAESLSVTVFALPFGFAVGVLPAGAAALFDWFLARRNVGCRPLWCFLFGSLVAFPTTLSSTSLKTYLLFGLVGAIPAALCAWLASADLPGRAR